MFRGPQPITERAPPRAPSEYIAVGILRIPVAKMTAGLLAPSSWTIEDWGFTLQENYRGSWPSHSSKLDTICRLLENLMLLQLIIIRHHHPLLIIWLRFLIIGRGILDGTRRQRHDAQFLTSISSCYAQRKEHEIEKREDVDEIYFGAHIAKAIFRESHSETLVQIRMTSPHKLTPKNKD